MRILLLNWRDIKNPASGGAEILTHEIAKRLVKKGNKITQFSSRFPNSKREEVIDGINFIREGNADIRNFFNSVHFAAYRNYKKYFQGNFDLVIDEIHGIPFFTPLYVKERKIALICEVAGRIWDTNFPFPFNLLGKFTEHNYFRFYRGLKFLTISNSTKEELLMHGLKEGDITVLPMGFTKPKSLPNFSKERDLTIIFVARLLKAKGVEDAIKACNFLKKDVPKIKLWILGRGEKSYEKELKELVKSLKLTKNVRFWGFVDQNKKFELMQKSHYLVVPSLKEGFGLTIPEAGYVGTPSIGYNVEGVRDIITDSKNGFLVEPNYKDLAIKIKRNFENKDLYDKLSKNSITFSKPLDWGETAEKALRAIEE